MNEFCIAVYNFFRDKCYLIRNITPEECSFEDWDDMLTQIKNDIDVASWAITEIPFWYMPKEYYESLVAGRNENDDVVFKLENLYFITDGNKITLVKPVTKLVEITTWIPCSESDSMQDTIDNLYRQQGKRI